MDDREALGAAGQGDIKRPHTVFLVADDAARLDHHDGVAQETSMGESISPDSDRMAEVIAIAMIPVIPVAIAIPMLRCVLIDMVELQ